jgi:NitT/TauT family transport system permease protein
MEIAHEARRKVLALLFIAGFFALWEVLCLALNVSDLVLPRPSQIVATLIARAPVLWPHTVQTLGTTMLGFALGVLTGVLIGSLIGVSRTAYDTAYPLMIAFSSIPKVAVVPIFVLWFGSGTVPAVLTSLVICFFPIVVNIATGLATTEPELEDVLRALGASKLDIMRKVGIPRSLPYFFGSLKVAITLAFVGAVVSETVGANKGIGKLMLDAQAAFQVPIVFAGLLVLAVLGILLYAATAMIEKRFTGWAFRGQANR